MLWQRERSKREGRSFERMRCSEHHGNMVRDKLRKSPPAQAGHKSNRLAKMDFYGTYIYLNEQVTLQNQDPVLNEAAQRLGVSLRQTEDELTRNMLASTASFLNCINGTNARHVGVAKSSLIDLELLAA